MINLSQDIQPLSTFKRNTNELITQMRNTGHPIVLTINGKAELVVQDATSYQQLL
ncbi:MAG: type II toxin-antitoxin system prevent-host-death family antitoxin, partial [Pseudanabaena sp.]